MIWFTSRISGRPRPPTTVIRAGQGGFNVILRQLLNDILETAVLGNAPFFPTVIFVERGFNVRLRRHAQLDFRVEQMRQRVNRIQVGRVGNARQPCPRF